MHLVIHFLCVSLRAFHSTFMTISSVEREISNLGKYLIIENREVLTPHAQFRYLRYSGYESQSFLSKYLILGNFVVINSLDIDNVCVALNF